MTPEQFVEEIRKHVLESTTSDTIEVIQRPPGRRPPQDLVELAMWFNGLPEADREMTRRVVALCAHQAVFGFLAVLDGARQLRPVAFADGSAEGHLELCHVHGPHRDVISCGLNGAALHELL